MKNAKADFQSLINQTKNSRLLYEYIRNCGVPLDASDLLRWQWVLAVSALDKFIHDVIRIGMVQEFLNRRPKTDKYQTFLIDLKAYSDLKASQTPEINFEKIIIQKHSFLAFQYPDKIADALSLIWPESNKWDKISQRMATPITSHNLKTKLNIIVTRRNQIVHEGDCFPGMPLSQQPINQADTIEVINFITELVDAIYTLVV